EAVRALGLALRDPDASLREAAIEMLGEIGGNEPVELLQLALTDGSPAVRQTAAQVLAELEAGSDR
ncbi:MAG: HEAT repeat domain-containing protein, partial [Gammaproteobacteria bacterium]|nr:HEAT repeat domain-containing protein [Gammaproteobacteria bacterium]